MSEFIGEIEDGIRQALKRAKYVVIPPAPHGKPALIYHPTVKAGIKWVPCPVNKTISTIRKPYEHDEDPDGTVRILQWDAE